MENGIIELIVDNDSWKERQYPINQPKDSVFDNISVSSIELWKENGNKQLVIRDSENETYIYDVEEELEVSHIQI